MTLTIQSLLYVIVIVFFGIVVTAIMTYFLETGTYQPVYGECLDVEYNLEVCKEENVTKFNVRGGFETQEFSLRINEVLIGQVAPRESLSQTMLSDERYEVMPEVNGYACYNAVKSVVLKEVKGC